VLRTPNVRTRRALPTSSSVSTVDAPCIGMGIIMSKLLAGAVTLLLILSWVPAAAALYIEHKTEEFGPPPPSPKPLPDGIHGLRFAPGRSYWLYKNWSGWGQFHDEALVACQGNGQAANEALTRFAALPLSAKEIRLFPAPGLVRSLDGKTILPCDWHIQWVSHTSLPRGERKETVSSASAVMTVFIARAAPIPALDGQAAEWIKNLDHDRFPIRQQAFRALAAQGEAARPLLRQVLLQNPTMERKRRIERLLDDLQSIHLLRVKVPKGMSVSSLDALLEREGKSWRSGDLGKSCAAAEKIAGWAEYSEATFPLLLEMLQDDRDYVHTRAVKAFTRLGPRAAAVLPPLRGALAQASTARRDPLRQALQAIEEAPEVSGSEEQHRNRALRKAIAEFCRSWKS
jgi:hypothetical protein